MVLTMITSKKQQQIESRGSKLPECQEKIAAGILNGVEGKKHEKNRISDLCPKRMIAICITIVSVSV